MEKKKLIINVVENTNDLPAPPVMIGEWWYNRSTSNLYRPDGAFYYLPMPAGELKPVDEASALFTGGEALKAVSFTDDREFILDLIAVTLRPKLRPQIGRPKEPTRYEG